jgi:hypothetical protein
MKRFMYLSIGVLCLSVSALIGFHAGARTAQAQASDFQAGFRIAQLGSQGLYAYYATTAGDVYAREIPSSGGHWDGGGTAQYLGNFFGGQPVPVSPSTLGGVKSKYR